jgi:hypothetical protein
VPRLPDLAWYVGPFVSKQAKRAWLAVAWLAVGIAAGCFVPTIYDLPPRDCDDPAPGCPAQQVCVERKCQPLPRSPCPEGRVTPCGLSAGSCEPGQMTCEDGQFSECVGAIGPLPEVCNSVDDDCDGVVDDDVQVTEVCNGVDDDCDGRIDDDAPLGALCEIPRGVCSEKQRACVNGAHEQVCTAASYGPLYEELEVTCDKFDNDCDGRPDASGVRPLTAATPKYRHASVARTQDGWLVAAWKEPGQIVLLNYDAQLQAVPGVPERALISARAGVSAPHLVPYLGLAGGFLVTWAERSPTTDVLRVRVARVDARGTHLMLNAGTPIIPTFNEPDLFGAPRVASLQYDPNVATEAILLVWVDGTLNELRYRILDSNGNLLFGPSSFLPDTTTSRPAVTTFDAVGVNGVQFVVGWNEGEKVVLIRCRYPPGATGTGCDQLNRAAYREGGKLDTLRVADLKTARAGVAYLMRTDSVPSEWRVRAATWSLFDGWMTLDQNLATPAEEPVLHPGALAVATDAKGRVFVAWAGSSLNQIQGAAVEGATDSQKLEVSPRNVLQASNTTSLSIAGNGTLFGAAYLKTTATTEPQLVMNLFCSPP